MSSKIDGLTSDERSEIHDMFARLDPDDTGKLTVDRLCEAVLYATKRRASAAAARKIIRTMDRKHGEAISEAEFTNYIATKMATDKHLSSDDLYRSEQGDLVKDVGYKFLEIVKIFRRKKMLEDVMEGGKWRDRIAASVSPLRSQRAQTTLIPKTDFGMMVLQDQGNKSKLDGRRTVSSNMSKELAATEGLVKMASDTTHITAVGKEALEQMSEQVRKERTKRMLRKSKTMQSDAEPKKQEQIVAPPIYPTVKRPAPKIRPKTSPERLRKRLGDLAKKYGYQDIATSYSAPHDEPTKHPDDQDLGHKSTSDPISATSQAPDTNTDRLWRDDTLPNVKPLDFSILASRTSLMPQFTMDVDREIEKITELFRKDERSEQPVEPVSRDDRHMGESEDLGPNGDSCPAQAAGQEDRNAQEERKCDFNDPKWASVLQEHEQEPRVGPSSVSGRCSQRSSASIPIDLDEVEGSPCPSIRLTRAAAMRMEATNSFFQSSHDASSLDPATGSSNLSKPPLTSQTPARKRLPRSQSTPPDLPIERDGKRSKSPNCGQSKPQRYGRLRSARLEGVKEEEPSGSESFGVFSSSSRECNPPSLDNTEGSRVRPWTAPRVWKPEVHRYPFRSVALLVEGCLDRRW